MSNFEPHITAAPAGEIQMRRESRSSVKTVTSLAMLTALTYLAMLLSNLLPRVANFLQMEVKGTVIAIGGFLFGPLSAAIISIVVAFLEMFTVSDTGIIGCIMNLLAACAFACPAAFIYQKMRSRKGAVIGLSAGIVTLTVVMLLWNYLITPIYMHMDRSVVAAMLPTVFLPFNLVKGGLNMALTLILYKPVVTALRKARLAPEREGAPSGDRFDAGFLLFSLALLATFALLVLVLAGKI
ncbi:MAG: ECF transporter S component [Oscillibacter sp.]|nr:ECF transporter S component [Oscillibacter sp.]